jgi:hypothetical protein
MIIFQWISMISINVWFLYKMITKTIKKQMSLFDILVLVVLDLILSCIFVFPQVSQILASFFGIGRGVDFILYVSIIILFFTVLNIYFRLEKLREEISNLNRALTLKDAQREKLSPSA